MTSELTGIEGVQLGIFLYHFLHSHLGKTKYIRNVSGGATVQAASIWYSTHEAGSEPLGRCMNILSPQRFTQMTIAVSCILDKR
jgi:hypothetical protein